MTTWSARSKDHIDPDAHTLYVYAIGMKIDGVSPDYLRSHMQVFPGTSGSQTSYPTATASVTGGYLMIGGGGIDNWNSFPNAWGNMLTASYPSSSNTWMVSGKDHRKTSGSTIDAYAIGIQNISYPTVGYLQVSYSQGNNYGPLERISYCQVPGGWAVTCCGGWLNWSGYGRMIMSIYPKENEPLSVREYSKDHTYSSSAHNYVYAMRLQKAL